MEKIRRVSRALIFAAGFSMLAASAGNAWSAGAPTVSATISATQLTSTSFQYTLTLTDAAGSPSPIGTFWYAWVPGKDFLTTSPPSISITSPSGWTPNPTHTGSTDGYAIQWVASSSAADPIGNTLTGFSFISSDTPSSVFGNSSFYPTFPTDTSVAYEAAPFSDAGTTFVVTPITPEPASLALLMPAALLLGRRPRRPATV